MDDFSYSVMDEEKAQEMRYSLLPEGDYRGMVDRYEGKISASGNRMVVFSVVLEGHDGTQHYLDDYIALTPKMAWKLLHHCKSAGLENEYMEKSWHPRMSVGRNVTVKVIRRKGNPIPSDRLNGKPEGSCYPDSNAIDDYVFNDGVAPKKEGFMDDIPF